MRETGVSVEGMGTMMGTGTLRHTALSGQLRTCPSSCERDASEIRTAGNMSTCSVLGDSQ